MAWDWTASGRVDSFEFEQIPVSSVNNRPTRKLAGIAGGSLSWKYDSELKVSGQLQVSDTPFMQNCYIRIWYTPRLNSATQRIEVATCFASTEDGHYEDGKYSGTITLRSVLARFADDKMTGNFTIPKGASAIAYFKKMFQWNGGQYAIKGVKDRKVSANQVFEWGKSPMEPLQWLADFLGAQITEDPHGRVVLQPYVTPGKKPVSYTIPVGTRSVTLPGVDIGNDMFGTTNRATVRYKWTEQYQSGGKTESREKAIIATAKASPASAISREKAGRFITETYELTSLNPKTQANANKIAATKLKQASGTTVKYVFNCFYLPIQIGQVVRFRYDKIDIDGLVTDVDLSLEPGVPMTVTLRKVRGR